MTDSQERDEALLPCPFCGSVAHAYAPASLWFIQCQTCGIETPSTDLESAKALWNARQSAPQQEQESVTIDLDERAYSLVESAVIQYAVPDGYEQEILKAGTCVWLSRWTEDQLEDARRRADELHRKLNAAPQPAVPLTLKDVVAWLEGTAGNTDTSPKWLAATELRRVIGWETLTIGPQPAEPDVVRDALYNELIMAVSRKYAGESRHQTALRYIRQAESPHSGGVTQTLKPAAEGAGSVITDAAMQSAPKPEGEG